MCYRTAPKETTPSIGSGQPVLARRMPIFSASEEEQHETILNGKQRIIFWACLPRPDEARIS